MRFYLAKTHAGDNVAHCGKAEGVTRRRAKRPFAIAPVHNEKQASDAQKTDDFH